MKCFECVVDGLLTKIRVSAKFEKTLKKKKKKTIFFFWLCEIFQRNMGMKMMSFKENDMNL
jgi:hypothetical protein